MNQSVSQSAPSLISNPHWSARTLTLIQPSSVRSFLIEGREHHAGGVCGDPGNHSLSFLISHHRRRARIVGGGAWPSGEAVLRGGR